MINSVFRINSLTPIFVLSFAFLLSLLKTNGLFCCVFCPSPNKGHFHWLTLGPKSVISCKVGRFGRMVWTMMLGQIYFPNTSLATFSSSLCQQNIPLTQIFPLPPFLPFQIVIFLATTIYSNVVYNLIWGRDSLPQ